MNELPQIINVLKGDLSLIGPRPLPKNEFDLYDENVKEIISKIRPGITGIGSLIFRDEEGSIAKNMPENPKLFYENVGLPYKGCWRLGISIIFLLDRFENINSDFWSLLKKDSDWFYKRFTDIPEKPETIFRLIN
ncbi:MAG: sugar transferase [Saprospiraceae bacterium]|nr:sugar transferase [Saprospiraceae bacterium]